ncbi:tripartite tricarboxylate transporter substrate binding protein [Siccirubricoccus sp. G192]|uniref:tripartite tricarboxylate transporter substrate binding protein n=1 Tax=Siccirubricoccus sp. G192 TaxID=2849651 RepID=UPI001C2B8663|nr:tripartite tricarboxylate transporter substrate binding protein [Siccirubricoccus sp. G192]MBV1795835.1 tripartite tricarboxylate transporter substrate binding protein [Siccirubricoccus sp. G192]
MVEPDRFTPPGAGALRRSGGVGRRALLTAAGLLAAPAVRAQRWPAGPVRIVSTFTPGGANDLLGRVAAQILTTAFRQSFVVENRPGAGGNLGMEAVARAAPDGHTLVVAAGAAAINQTLYRNLPFDLLHDFAPVTLLGVVPNVLAVHPSVPARTAAEFVELARRSAGGITYGSAGIGTIPHLAMALFLRTVGAEGVHVPYRGSAPAVTDLVGGRVQALFENLPPLAQQIRAGGVRALGISTLARHPDFPDLPTVAEAVPLPGFEVTAWQSLLAPRGTPPEIVEAMATAIRLALAGGEGQARVARIGALARPLAPAELRAFLATEVAKWAEAVRTSGAKVE